MDIGLTQLPSIQRPFCLNAGTYGRWGRGLGRPSPPASCIPTSRVITFSGDSAIAFSGMEMETLVRYKNFPGQIVVLNNGGIGPGMPEIRKTDVHMKPTR